MAIDQAQIRDEHRLLIGPRDVLHNQAQINALEQQGYTGLYSYEPFSAQVQAMPTDELSKALDENIELIRSIG